MTDLDADLQRRLSRLAAAVPTARGRVDPVHRSAVTARHGVRMAWITPLVVVVLLTLVAGLFSVGPFAPTNLGTPRPVDTDRWTSTVKSGDFELRLVAAKPTFAANEPLDVLASLVYLGPDERVVIHYLTWGPLEFEMWAPGVTLMPRGRWSCDEMGMTRGIPMTEALLDLGNGAAPFTVSHGLHEITATAEFGRGSCDQPADAIETSIVVAVADGPDDIPIFTDEGSQGGACLLMRNGGRLAISTTGLGVVTRDGKRRDVVWPSGYSARRTAEGAVLLDRDGRAIAREGDDVAFDAITLEGQPLRPCGDVSLATNGPDTTGPTTDGSDSPEATGTTNTVTANVATGTFELGISAPSVVVANGWFTISTTHAYLGPLDRTTVSAFYPVPTFTITQLDATSPTNVGAVIVDAACREWAMARDVPTTGSLGFVSDVSGDGVDRDWMASHVDGAELRLPAGIWRITASFGAYFAPECAGSEQSIETSIVLAVLSMTPAN